MKVHRDIKRQIELTKEELYHAVARTYDLSTSDTTVIDISVEVDGLTTITVEEKSAQEY